MKKLTRNELRNVLGGGDPLPPGCYCFNFVTGPGPGLPGGGVDPDCSFAPNQQYCPDSDVMVCC